MRDRAMKVALVELTVYPRFCPLTSGYLQAYACRDPEIARTYSFRAFSLRISPPPRAKTVDHSPEQFLDGAVWWRRSGE